MLQNSTLVGVSNSFLEYYNDVFYVQADPRVRDRFLMGDPSKMIAFYVLYAIAIKCGLVRYMKTREPFNTRQLENYVNFLLFLVSLGFAVPSTYIALVYYNWWCEPIDRSESPLAMFIIFLGHMYVLSKFLYVLECLVIVLRKSESFMTTYLLVHHTMYPLASYVVFSYYPGGQAASVVFITSLFHMVLFGFKLVADNCWLHLRLYRFKTPLGIVFFILQNALVLMHASFLLINNSCNYPMGYPKAIYIICLVGSLIILLFVISAYVRNRKERRSRMRKVNV